MNVNFAGATCKVDINRYYNDNARIQLYDIEDGCPVATATINIPEKLQPGEVVIKDYSENAGIYNVLVAAKVIKPQHREHVTGMVTCPVCYLNR